MGNRRPKSRMRFKEVPNVLQFFLRCNASCVRVIVYALAAFVCYSPYQSSADSQREQKQTIKTSSFLSISTKCLLQHVESSSVLAIALTNTTIVKASTQRSTSWIIKFCVAFGYDGKAHPTCTSHISSSIHSFVCWMHLSTDCTSSIGIHFGIDDRSSGQFANAFHWFASWSPCKKHIKGRHSHIFHFSSSIHPCHNWFGTTMICFEIVLCQQMKNVLWTESIFLSLAEKTRSIECNN